MTVDRPSIFLPLMLALLCSSLSCQDVGHAARKNEQKRDLMKLHHLPFRARTYVPVTIDNIEESSSFRIWIYGRNPAIDEILSILRGNPTEQIIDKSEVRLKVVYETKLSQLTLVADMHGIVMDTVSGMRWQVDAEQLQTLTTMIERLHGIVDQRPTIDLFD